MLAKTKIIAVLVLCIFPIHLFAQSHEEQTSFKHHELRLGIDDPFINMIFDDGIQGFNYIHTGRLFLDYQYRFNKWLSVGANLGWCGAFSSRYYLRNGNIEKHFMQFSLMPKVKCTYFHSKWVELYAAGAIGALCETSSEGSNNKVYWYGTTQVTLFGLAVGNGQWFGAFEIAPAIYFNGTEGMAPTPMSLFNISVSYRF